MTFVILDPPTDNVSEPIDNRADADERADDLERQGLAKDPQVKPLDALPDDLREQAREKADNGDTPQSNGDTPERNPQLDDRGNPVKHSEDQAVEDVDPEVVDHTDGDDPVGADPPERSVSDDPVEWIPGDFVDTIDGTPAVNKKGFRVLQHWYDISTDAEVVVPPEETDYTFCRVRATATMPDGRTAVAHGSAHVDRGDDHYLLLEMADTRAKNRALSDITGVGAVAVQELKSELEAGTEVAP